MLNSPGLNGYSDDFACSVNYDGSVYDIYTDYDFLRARSSPATNVNDAWGINTSGKVFRENGVRWDSCGYYNSPVTNERLQVFPISPTGYYAGEVPIINVRSYGKTDFTLSGHAKF